MFFAGRPADVLSFHGADWLERSEREIEELPETALEKIGIRQGQTVADVGAMLTPRNLKLWTVPLARYRSRPAPCLPGNDCVVNATLIPDLTLITAGSHQRRFLATPEHE